MDKEFIEKEFFETFKIPKQFILPVGNFKYSYKNYKEAYKINRTCNNWEHQETINELKKGSYKYPQITDRILLELICIISRELGDNLNIKTLKKRIIQDSIYCYNDNSNEKFKQKVQELFKEE